MPHLYLRAALVFGDFFSTSAWEAGNLRNATDLWAHDVFFVFPLFLGDRCHSQVLGLPGMTENSISHPSALVSDLPAAGIWASACSGIFVFLVAGEQSCGLDLWTHVHSATPELYGVQHSATRDWLAEGEMKTYENPLLPDS